MEDSEFLARTFEFRIRVPIESLRLRGKLKLQSTVEYVGIPLESSMTVLFTLSVSSNLEKWPGPEPRSRIELKFRLISYYTCVGVKLNEIEHRA